MGASVKNILVTGADGFIGRRLTTRLREIGYEVFGHSKADGDIATADFNSYKADHVIHLAAMTFVPKSWENTYEFYRVNVMGTENVLEYCRKTNAGLTFLSTYVYGTPEFVPVSEEHKINPNTPYNHSKVICESLCEFYNKVFGVNVVVLRPFNIYGAGQARNFLIPIIINQYLDEKTDIINVMDLTPKRDYLYVDDLVEAISMTPGRTGYHVYNVGSGVSVSVEDVIKTILRMGSVNKPYTGNDNRRQGEIDNVVADISKIKRELGWQPKVSWETGIKKMLEEMK